MATEKEQITDSQRDAAEAEIKAKQREVKYDLRDFTVDFIVSEFKKDNFFVPDYQRRFVWDERRRWRFIESVILGLPIPMMFVADLDDGRLEIVDGAQRIQTLESFLNGDLQLTGLERLEKLNGFRYVDLPESQRRKIGTRPLRVVVLEDSTTPETRQTIFDRINTSPLHAKPAEVRRGSYQGALTRFISECSVDPLFRQLCPMSEMLRKRRENEELVLRFFAYSDEYRLFKHDVEAFLTSYVRRHQDHFNEKRMENEFRSMLEFVKAYFPSGFAKSSRATSTPRVRFEAISVGVNLALRQVPTLQAPDVRSWINSSEFDGQTTTHASNSARRLRARVEFVRDKLLGR